MKKKHIYKLSAIINEFNESYIKDNINSTYLSGYYVTSEAPNTYKELAMHRSCKTLPVYSGGSKNTIYKHSYQNYNFRFVHDLHHIKMRVDFSLKGERAAIRAHYDKLQAWLLNNYIELAGDVCLLFLIDTIRQVDYYYTHKKYVANQLEFAIDMFSVCGLRQLENLAGIE